MEIAEGKGGIEGIDELLNPLQPVSIKIDKGKTGRMIGDIRFFNQP